MTNKYIIITTISGCAIDTLQNNPIDPSIYSLDTSIYFKINYNGQSYRSYGIKTQELPTNSPLLKGSYYVRVLQTADNLGNTQHSLTSNCIGSLGNSLILGSALPQNQCDFITTAMKVGTIEGNYTLTGIPQYKEISDSAVSIYTIDTRQAYNFTIYEVDSLNISGSFNFLLIAPDGLTRIPATGSFRLNKL